MGWIKYALQHGYKIYPCYTFGEELTYWNWGGLMKYRLMMNKYQLPGCIFVGKFCSWLPANDLDLVTGELRPSAMQSEPSQAKKTGSVSDG